MYPVAKDDDATSVSSDDSVLVEAPVEAMAANAGLDSVALMERVKPSVLKINVTSKSYDHSQPWNAPDIESCSGSGFVIELADGQKYIVTNAHVEEGSVRITVRQAGGKKDFTSHKVLVDHRCDLALLALPQALSSVPAIPINDHFPRLGESVHVIGFPQLGEKICITKGGVSRCELDEYAQSEWEGIQFGVDAVINPGNSGGPAVNEQGELLGVAFQGADNGQGFVIPSEVLQHFLQDFIRHGAEHYGSFPSLALKTQEMPSKVVRRSKGLPKGTTGVIIRKVPPLSSAHGQLQEGDILAAVDGHSVSNEGEVKIRGTWLHWSYLMSQKFIGDDLAVTVYRGGQRLELAVPLRHTEDHCRAVLTEYEREPEFIVLSGLVLKVLTENDGGIIEEDGLSLGDGEKKQADDQRLFVQSVLESDYTKGFNELVPAIIKKVNGHEVNNMKALLDNLAASGGQYHTITLKSGSELVIENILTNDKGRCHHDAMLKEYDVRNSCSQALRDKAIQIGLLPPDATESESQSVSGSDVESDNSDTPRRRSKRDPKVPPHPLAGGGLTPGLLRFQHAIQRIEARVLDQHYNEAEDEDYQSDASSGSNSSSSTTTSSSSSSSSSSADSGMSGAGERIATPLSPRGAIQVGGEGEGEGEGFSASEAESGESSDSTYHPSSDSQSSDSDSSCLVSGLSLGEDSDKENCQPPAKRMKI